MIGSGSGKPAGQQQVNRDRLICLRNYLIDGLYSVLPRWRRTPGERTPVLVVRLDAIGDFVLWLDAARGLRCLYPANRYRLVLVGNALWTELAAVQPLFDEVIPIDTTRLNADGGYRRSTWRLIRS